MLKKLSLLLSLPLILSAQAPVVRSLLVPNDGTTGTTLNKLAKINSSGNAIIATTSDTALPLYCVTAGAGTTGSATLVSAGSAACLSDAGGATAGDFLVASTTTAATLHDAGATAPTSGFVLGTALTTAAANASVTYRPLGYNAASSGGSTGFAAGSSWYLLGNPGALGSGAAPATAANAGRIRIFQAASTSLNDLGFFTQTVGVTGNGFLVGIFAASNSASPLCYAAYAGSGITTTGGFTITWTGGSNVSAGVCSGLTVGTSYYLVYSADNATFKLADTANNDGPPLNTSRVANAGTGTGVSTGTGSGMTFNSLAGVTWTAQGTGNGWDIIVSADN